MLDPLTLVPAKVGKYVHCNRRESEQDNTFNAQFAMQTNHKSAPKRFATSESGFIP